MARRDPVKFQVKCNLADRQSALLMSGRGERLLVELELFGVEAAVGLVGFASLTGQPFVIDVRSLTEKEIEVLRNAETIPTQ